ncbi:MAG: immunoglobulin domain-containing protein, partial [Verrucomicrobiae bacterium]
FLGFFQAAGLAKSDRLLGTTNGGGVSCIQTADRVAVTFQAVKTYSTLASSSFQIEMFFSGIIRITWLSADGFGTVVGLSNAGGQPSTYVSPGSDLSGYPLPVSGVPAQPGTPVLTPLTSSTMRVQWTDNSTIELGYRVERSANGSSGWAAVASTGENAVECTDTGLTASTTYYYRVVGFSANGDGAASASASATALALPQPPAAPSALVAVATGTTTVALGWADNSSNETGFRIQRSTDNSTWSALLSPAANATSAEDTSASRNSTYFYRACATNDGGNSSWSNSATATTPATGEFTAPAYAVWKLNETSGTTAVDSSGNARSATTANATWSQGDSGHDGLAFNGSTSRLSVGTLAGLPGPDFTISFWFKANAFSNCLLFSKSDTVFPVLSIGLYNWTGSEWNIQVMGGSYGRTLRDMTTPSLTNLVAGQWVHITCVYNDAERRVYTYKDGVALPTTELYNPITWSSIAACFGQKSSDGTQSFNGKLDDIRIYSRALTAADVLDVRDSYSAVVAGSPAITSQPSAATVNAGGNATFSVSATGAPAPSYQWRKGGTDIPGATSAMLALTNVQSSDAATYSVTVSNTAGSVTSNAAVLTVQTAPAITSQPSSTTVAVGANATFTVAATGNPAPTCQWRKDGTNISGATSSSLTISSAQLSHAGIYSAVATNAAGSATSNNATLTVQPPPAAPGAPVLTPLSMTSIRVQWTDNSSDETGFKVERSADGATGWTLVTTTAANATSFDDTGLTGSTTYYYRVSVTRSGTDSATTSVVSAQTLAETIPPTVLSASSSSATQVLMTFSEAVAAPSANVAANYGIPGLLVTAAARQANTSTVALTVSGMVAGSYTVTVTGVRDVAGNMIAASNVASFSYTAIPGAGMMLWLRGDAGVTQTNGTVSAWADQAGNGTISATQATAASQPAFVSSGVNGKPVVRFDGTDDNLAFSDVPVNTLTGMTIFMVSANAINQAPATHANASAIFWSEASSWGTVYLSPYQSKVNYRFGTGQVNNIPTYTRASSVGGNFTITAAVHSGTSEAVYADGTSVFTATGKLAAIANTNSSGFLGRGNTNAGTPTSNYYFQGDIAEVIVYNRTLGAEELSQVNSYLSIKYFCAAPAIITQPASASVAPGGNATFTVAATGTPAPTYQWRKDGADISGAISANLTISNAQAANAGTYTVLLTNSAGSLVSNPATLTVQSPTPNAATSLAAVPTLGSGSTSITLTWADNSTNETGFRVEKALSTNGTWTEAVSASANGTSANATGLSPLTTYFFRVVAFNGANNASPSATDSAKTFFPPGTTADVNVNGCSDFLEYALAITDATTLSANLPTADVDAQNFLTLRFVRPEPAPADVEYQLWASDDLATWTQIANPASAIAASGATATVDLKDAATLTGKSKRFLRLVVLQKL